MDSKYNPFEAFAIDLAHKFKKIKDFEEGNDGFRYIGIASHCEYNDRLFKAQIQRYIKDFEQSENMKQGKLSIFGKTIKTPSDVVVTSIFASYLGDVSAYLLINLTDVEYYLSMPFTIDIRTSAI